jgi:phage-related protein
VNIIEDGIWELRITFAGNISRIFYFFYDRTNIIMTNGFVKKTQKTPREEIEKAKERKKKYEIKKTR